MYSTYLFSESMKLTQYSDCDTKQNIREQKFHSQRKHRCFFTQSIQTNSGTNTPH